MKTEIKDIILKYHPISQIKRWITRKKLKNDDFTILCSHCMGGIIYHILNIKFLSPTINLRIDSKDFIKFLNHINYYLSLPLEFYDEYETPYPLGKLGDITIHFNHYHTGEEALCKWNDRKMRINWNNIFVITNDLDGVTEEDILSLNNFPCRNKIVFTHQHYKDIPYTFYVGNEEKLKSILKKSKITGMYDFEKWFDYTAFLNT